MEITEAQYASLREALPVQRGNVSLRRLQLLNAVLYVLMHGCKQRACRSKTANWHRVYARLKRCAKNGVLDPVR